MGGVCRICWGLFEIKSVIPLLWPYILLTLERRNITIKIYQTMSSDIWVLCQKGSWRTLHDASRICSFTCTEWWRKLALRMNRCLGAISNCRIHRHSFFISVVSIGGLDIYSLFFSSPLSSLRLLSCASFSCLFSLSPPKTHTYRRQTYHTDITACVSGYIRTLLVVVLTSLAPSHMRTFNPLICCLMLEVFTVVKRETVFVSFSYIYIYTFTYFQSHSQPGTRRWFPKM